MTMTVMGDTVYLLTASRDLATGLAALLLSIPPVRRVESLPGLDAVLERLDGEQQPALIVLDAEELGQAAPEVVETVRAVCPDTRCLVLSDTVAQSRALLSSGIEPVVVKGVDPVTLVDAIEQLLSDET